MTCQNVHVNSVECSYNIPSLSLFVTYFKCAFTLIKINDYYVCVNNHGHATISLGSCTCSGRPCVSLCSGWCTPQMVHLPGSHYNPLQGCSGSFWALWQWGSLHLQPACKDGPVWHCSHPYPTQTSPHQWTLSQKVGLCVRLVSSSVRERDRSDISKEVYDKGCELSEFLHTTEFNCLFCVLLSLSFLF